MIDMIDRMWYDWYSSRAYSSAYSMITLISDHNLKVYDEEKYVRSMHKYRAVEIYGNEVHIWYIYICNACNAC
jgi:hypothetical protein